MIITLQLLMCLMLVNHSNYQTHVFVYIEKLFSMVFVLQRSHFGYFFQKSGRFDGFYFEHYSPRMASLVTMYLRNSDWPTLVRL